MKIKFSHRYYKLQGVGDTAVLISATPYKIDSNTPKDFIAYDTWYYPDGHYQLEPGDYVLLLFLGSNGVFTTIRRRYGSHGDSLEYYSEHVGEVFDIEIKDEDRMNILDQLKHDPVRHAWTINNIVALTREPIVKVLAEIHELERDGKIQMDGGLYHLTEKAWED